MRVVKLEVKALQKIAVCLFLVAGVLFGQLGYAMSIGDMASNVTGSFENIGKLMIAAAYIGGFALVFGALFKFKQHKDNPTQIPLGTPITLLCIGIVLVFLPSLFAPAGETIFGGSSSATGGGFTGSGATSIPGGSGS